MKKQCITMMPISSWVLRVNKFQVNNFLLWVNNHKNVKNPNKQISQTEFLDIMKRFAAETGLRAIYSMAEERFMVDEVDLFLQFCVECHGLSAEDLISPDDFRLLEEEFNQRGIFDQCGIEYRKHLFETSKKLAGLF